MRAGLVRWPGRQTDIWYTHISQADFDMVFAAEDAIGAITMAEYALLTDATMPKPYVPMAAPVRLTDNAMCKATTATPYCYIDFDNVVAIDPLALPTAPTSGFRFLRNPGILAQPWRNHAQSVRDRGQPPAERARGCHPCAHEPQALHTLTI